MKFISTCDELPPTDERVLFIDNFAGDPKFHIGYYYCGCGWYCECCRDCDGMREDWYWVTHWARLELPKELKGSDNGSKT